MVYTEIKEVTDVFVRAVISKLPRFKINCFAQEFSNDLLQAFFSENNENNKDLLKNKEGYFVMRSGNYVSPMLLNVLHVCAISAAEFLAFVPDQAFFKIDIGMISYVWGKDMKSIDLSPFKQNYFEIPLRVLKVAIQQRLSMLAYRQSFDYGYPNDFIPLDLVSAESLGMNVVNTQVSIQLFRALGLPVYLFSAEQLNKTTFGSHNSAQALDATTDTYGPGGDARTSLFSESEKIDFFSAGWWERIVMSKVVIDYAEESGINHGITEILNVV